MKITLETLLGKGYDANGRRMIPGPSVPAKPGAGPPRRKPGPSEPERIMMRHLNILKTTKLIRDFMREPYAFCLADDCKYTVDFWVVCLDGSSLFIETKGPYKREDGTLKWKWMAAELPNDVFILAERHGSRTLGYRWRYSFRQGRSRIVGKERAALLKRIGHLLP